MDRVLLRASSILALLVLSGCSCERAPQPARVVPDPPAEPEWPRAIDPDLPHATPATDVTVRRDRVDVDNAALVATWPADELSRARTEAPAGISDWPRVSFSVTSLGGELEIAPLREHLATARRAERAGTGAGTGAGAFDLRVASDVPYELVERVLYSAAGAGYGAPRVVLDADDGARMLAWPSARPGPAPSRDEIEAALRAVVEGRAPLDTSATANEPRAELSRERIELRMGHTVACTLDRASQATELEPCARDLAHASGSETIALAVARDLAFARVIEAMQRLARAFPQLRVVRAR